MITHDYHDTKASQKIHLVCAKQGCPKLFLIPLGHVGDRGKAYFGAECGEENVLVDKEAINCQFNILMKLDKLHGNLDNTLRHTLAILPSHISFHLED